MKEVQAIIRPHILGALKESLAEIDVKGLTVSQVMGCGNQKGWKEYYRGTAVELNMLPKIRISMVVPDDKVDAIIDTIVNTSRTGEIGDGKIFVTNVERAVRIRTGEEGDQAL